MMPRSTSSLSLYTFLSKVGHTLFPGNLLKLKLEYLYWWLKSKKEKHLTHSHYQFFYTDYFDLDLSFYQGKKVLDIGCGPRGSLEWAITSEVFGLDPLADAYKNLGTSQHRMKYIKAGAENMPFDNNSFDVISSFNSLDHVDDLETSIAEIKRILKPGGLFLLIADIHDDPTFCEPSAFSWNIVESFLPDFEVQKEKHLEGNELWKSIRKGTAFDHSNSTKRYGVLTAKMKKNISADLK